MLHYETVLSVCTILLFIFLINLFNSFQLLKVNFFLIRVSFLLMDYIHQHIEYFRHLFLSRKSESGIVSV
ncbi:hypothetical protein BpHYR1_037982 [Brachionus plicatilis]|uniref:Uncharacterized protein n=1 Tax=Brachionus plicatilis TaxID=10195 RepID=A0A3M7QN75_BRAPC|nr:hypothetical protein BpHYR1_037982 [Brachionus plicatilis]